MENTKYKINDIVIINCEREFRVYRDPFADYQPNDWLSKMMFLPNGTCIVITELNTNSYHPLYFKAYVPKLNIFIDAINFLEIKTKISP